MIRKTTMSIMLAAMKPQQKIEHVKNKTDREAIARATVTTNSCCEATMAFYTMNKIQNAKRFSQKYYATQQTAMVYTT